MFVKFKSTDHRSGLKVVTPLSAKLQLFMAARFVKFYGEL
jgi:hypothetical protein